MVKHIILWNLKDEYTQQEKEKIKKDIKLRLLSMILVKSMSITN